jgi:ATP-dependent Lon protease
MMDNVEASVPKKRDEYEIKEDVRAIKRALCIFKDPERLKDAQEAIKNKMKIEDSLQAVADGDLQKALGL